jgi:DNA-binding transcriptional regulator GbsR (MarR family)
MFENDGFSPLVGKIFALLLFAPAPLSLQDMADQLGVTKAAVSVQVRTLEKHAMCHKLPKSSDRRDYYYIANDFSMIVVHSIIHKMQSVLEKIDSTLNQFQQIQDIDDEDRPAYDASKLRFAEMQALYRLFIEKLSGLEEDWKERRQRLYKELGKTLSE